MPSPDPVHLAIAFGLSWRSDIALDGFEAAGISVAVGEPVDVYRSDSLPDRGGGRPMPGGMLYPDGIRFAWREEVVFDMRDGASIAYHPGRDWTGALPVCFYSTVAALTVAWRGLVPLHACAVAVDGKAVVIAGTTGVGKSTLTAGLVGLGADFVADDLTVVSVGAAHIRVPRGRPTIRLHPNTAARLDTTDAVAARDDPRGKWLASPRRRQRDDRLDLGAIVVIEDALPVETPPAVVLLAHLFRPRLLAALPNRAALIRDVVAMAARVSILSYPAQTDSCEAVQDDRAKDMMGRILARMETSQRP